MGQLATEAGGPARRAPKPSRSPRGLLQLASHMQLICWEAHLGVCALAMELPKIENETCNRVLARQAGGVFEQLPA